MDCDRNICYATESCEKCVIMQREKDSLSGKCIYPFEREVNGALWSKFLGDFGENDASHFENETFEVKAYDWSEKDDNDYHFHHKPSGFKIQWYKYALRGAMSNMEITHEQFLNIMKHCHNSMNPREPYDMEKWWGKEVR